MTTTTTTSQFRKEAVRLDAARFWALRSPQWVRIGNVGSVCEWSLDEGIQTACTDGRQVKFSPVFIKTLSDKELRFVVLHELMHVAFRHLIIWRGLWKKDPDGANVAMDAFINTHLTLEDQTGEIAMPPCGIPSEQRWFNRDVMSIYREMQPEQYQGHGFDQHDFEGAEAAEAEDKDFAQELDRALRQGEMLAKRMGDGSAGRQGVIGALLSPKQDWRAVTREWVQDICSGGDESTWSRVSRRFIARNMLMPGNVAECVGELVIGFDTSGSCFGGPEMTAAASHVKHIIEQLRPSKVHVAYVDTAVTGFQTFEEGQFEVAKLQPTGGGGTHLPVLWGYLQAKKINPVGCIFITDGGTAFGTAPAFPVLWAMTAKVRAPYGTTIQVEV